MIVDSIKSTGLGNGNSSSEKPDAMGQDTFLTLLVTQLQNQDPLNPLEGSEFTAQLAQFSSLEKLNMINDNIKSLHLYQSSMNNSQTVDFIGKKITASGNSIYLDQDMSKEIKFELESEAKTVFINIYSSDNRIIKTIETDQMHAGIQGVEWDGTDNNNNKIPEGEYTFEVQAVDLNGDPVRTAAFVSGRVGGVQFIDGVANLVVNNQLIPVGKVVEVAEN